MLHGLLLLLLSVAPSAGWSSPAVPRRLGTVRLGKTVRRTAVSLALGEGDPQATSALPTSSALNVTDSAGIVVPTDTTRTLTLYEKYFTDAPNPFANAVGETGSNRIPVGWAVLGLCCAIATISSLDRVMMSVAILPMAQEMSYSDTTKGLIAAAFTTGYFLCFLPAGVVAATSSPTITLTVGLIVWSAAQAATPAAAYSGLGVLLACRAVMGLGEAATFPSIQAIAARWVPEQYRSRFWGLLTACFNLGTVAAYALSPSLIDTYGWPSAFILYGAAGVGLAALWAVVGRDEPPSRDDCAGGECPLPGAMEEPPASSAGEVLAVAWQRARALPWSEIASSRPVWAMTAAACASNYFLYFAIAWLPSYFNYVYDLDTAASSSASAIPFTAAALGCAVAGTAADALVSRGVSLTNVRKGMAALSTLGPAAALLALASGADAMSYETAEALFIGGLGLHACHVVGYAVGVQDISKKSASLISGAAAGLGVMCGAASQYITGAILDANGRDCVPPPLHVLPAVLSAGDASQRPSCTPSRRSPHAPPPPPPRPHPPAPSPATRTQKAGAYHTHVRVSLRVGIRVHATRRISLCVPACVSPPAWRSRAGLLAGGGGASGWAGPLPALVGL